jgi:hypothetical protein
MGVGKPEDKITPGRHSYILKDNNSKIKRHMRNFVLFIRYYEVDKIKNEEMGGTCSTPGRVGKFI